MTMKRALIATLLLISTATAAWAFQAKSDTSSRNTAAVATGSAPAKLSAEDQAKKKELLESERYIELKMAFEDWLSVQNFYKAEQVPRLRSSLRKKIDSMTPRELELFMRQTEAKLAILMSPQAAEARDWLGHFVSARAVLPASEVDQWDFLNMTPAQMEQALRRVETRRSARAGANQAFNAARESSVQSFSAARNQNRANAQQQRTQARSSGGTGSPYAAPPPRRPPPPQRERPRIIVGPGGAGFVL